MQHQRPPIITPHRLARLTAWLLALLLWFACGGGPARRHRRYGHMGIEKLRASVRNIILIRAAELIPQRKQRKARIDARAGATMRNCSLRVIAGSALRRRLHARGSRAEQILHLIGALRDWRKLAARLARRRRNGLTRLITLIPTPAPAALAPAHVFAAIRPADTS